MTDSIEVRLCGAEGGRIGVSNENVHVELIELYIQWDSSSLNNEQAIISTVVVFMIQKGTV